MSYQEAELSCNDDNAVLAMPNHFQDINSITELFYQNYNFDVEVKPFFR